MNLFKTSNHEVGFCKTRLSNLTNMKTSIIKIMLSQNGRFVTGIGNYGSRLFLICSLFLVLGSCEKETSTAMLESAAAKPEWGPTITPEMQVIIEKLTSYNNPPLATLTPAQARMGKSIFNAFQEVMMEKGVKKPHANVDTVRISIPCSDGNIPAIVYTCGKGNGPLPVIVYYHGGGWVLNSPEIYDASARALSDMTGAIVVSIAYRKGPEFKFPFAHNDSFNAYKWVLANAASLKGDPKKIAVAGESAGGNLAAAVSLMARDKGIALPIHQLLVYPISGYDLNTESYLKYANATPLNKPSMQWFFRYYLNNPAEGNNPLISLVDAKLSGLPSTTIISAEIDPLQSEGLLLAKRLSSAGVKVVQKTFIGVTHEFFGMAALVPEAKEAQELASAELKKAFK